MTPPSPTNDESRRLEVLREYGVLDTPGEAAFDTLAAFAAQWCQTPVALVSLVDRERLWFKAHVGLAAAEAPREGSLCAEAIRQPGLFIVADATLEQRFAVHPLVRDEPCLRSYAGVPLVSREGEALGTLCVMDSVVREFTAGQRQALETLGRQTMAQLDLRRQARELDRLRAERDRLALAFKAARQGMFDLNLETGEAVVNEEYSTMLGYDPSENQATLARWAELLHPDDRAHAQATLAACVRGEITEYRLEYRLRTREGGWKWLLSVGAAAERDAHGRPRRLLGTHTDISDRKNTENALRSLFEASAVGIALTVKRVMWKVNAAFCAITGYGEAELVGQGSGMLYPDQAEADRVGERLYRDLHEQGTGTLESRWRRKDGRLIDVLLKVNPIDPADWEQGLTTTVIDITERKRIEQEVGRLSEWLLRTQRISHVGGWAFNMKTGEVWVSPEARRIYGAGDDEPLSIPRVQSYTLPDCRPMLSHALRALVDQGQPYNVEFQIRRGADGATVDIHSMAEYNAEEGIVLGVIEDITERKRAAAALRRSEARFKLFFERQVVGMAITSPVKQWVEVNDRLCRMLGYSREELTRLTWAELTHPEDLSADLAHFEQLLAGSIDDYSMEKRFLRKDGSIVHANLSIAGVRQPDGSVDYVLAVLEDISERKRAETALAEQRRFLSDLVEHSGTLISVKDTEGRYQLVNRQWEEVTGLAREQVLGRTDDLLFPGASGETFRRHDREAMESGRAVEREEGLATTWGQRHFISTKFPLRDEAGRVTGVCAMTTDITERKKAEAALRQNRLFLAELVEHSGALIFVKDLEGRYLLINRKWEKVTGLTRQEVLGKTDDVLFPANASAFRANDREAIQSGTAVEREEALETAAGQRHFLSVKFPLRDDAGQVTGVCGMTTEITERKRAEAAERETRRLLRDVLDTVPVRVFWKDRESRYLGCNLPFAKDAGLTAPDQVVGRSDFEIGLNEQAELYRADDRQVMESGVPKLGYEEPQTAPRGERVWLRTSKIPLRDAAGAVVGVLGTYEDITGQKAAQESLRESERKYRELVENANSIILRWNPQGIVTFLNEFGQTFFGFPEAEIVGRHVVGTIVPETEDGGRDLRPLMERICADPAAFERNVNENQCRDGTKLWVAWTNKAIFDAQGHLLEVLSIGTDITERKWAEDEKERLQGQLLQAQKMDSVGRLAGGVAHDFNNMLQAILGNVELALEQPGVTPALREDLGEIRQAAQRSADLTRQLLAFARKQTVAPKVLDLNETVGGMLKMLQRLLGENLQLAWLPGADLWPVRMDPAQLDQILANLTVNSRDAIAGVGRVSIETGNVTLDEAGVAGPAEGVPGDYVQLAVSDTGCGMDPETQAHLFEPFFTTKPVGRGTGLGLATVYGIVKQNGGFIRVYSEVGRGTTFRVYLPRSEAEAGRVAEREGGAALRGTETVLLVEDEEQVLRLGQRILERQGYTVLGAYTPAEALRRVGEHAGPLHLLVTDVVMPGMNGRELRERVAGLKPGVKCLFMSGYTADVIAHQGVLEAGVEFLQKPFTADALGRKVREVLDGPANP